MTEHQGDPLLPTPEDDKEALLTGNLLKDPEGQWLLRALQRMQAQIKSGLDIESELIRLVAWYQESSEGELLIAQAMGIVALVGLPYVSDGRLETRHILEAAPDIILHTAANSVEDIPNFIMLLTQAIEDFCSELCEEAEEAIVIPLEHEIDTIPARLKANNTMTQLAFRAQAGDGFAANKILQKCGPMVRTIIKRWRFFIPGGETVDLQQEGLFGVVKAIRDYDVSKGSFMNFAQLAAYRQIVTAVKTARRNKHRSLNEATSLDQPSGNNEDMGTLGEITSDFLTRVEHVVIAHEELAELDALLMSVLSDMEYEATTLAAQGFSYEEIGQAIGEDVKAVDNALQRAKHKIVASDILSRKDLELQ